MEEGCPCIMQNNCDNQVTFGGFFVRMAAYLIDGIIVGIGLLFVRLSIALLGVFAAKEIFTSAIIFNFTLKDVVLYLCGAAYFIVLTYCTGTTLGKKAMNLRVVGKNGMKPTLFQIIYRETVGRFLCSVTLGIGYLMVGIDRQKRGLHDVICDTYVVYEKKVRVVPVPAYVSPKPTQEGNS